MRLVVLTEGSTRVSIANGSGKSPDIPIIERKSACYSKGLGILLRRVHKFVAVFQESRT